jgi:hypothetical protein
MAEPGLHTVLPEGVADTNPIHIGTNSQMLFFQTHFQGFLILWQFTPLKRRLTLRQGELDIATLLRREI